MPRKYIRKTVDRDRGYTPQDVANALEELKIPGKKFQSVCKQFGIPPKTLRNRIKRRSQSFCAGRKTLLSKELEDDLEEAILVLQNQLRPLTQHEVMSIIQEFMESLDMSHPWKKTANNTPGVDFLMGFRKRHPRLSLKVGEEIQVARVSSLTAATINSWFDLYEDTIRKLNITQPGQISNADETGYEASVAARVLAAKGLPCAQAQTGNSKTSYSVVETVSADGHIFPPYTIYKSKYLYSNWLVGGPPGACYNRSENGWQDRETFLAYFKKFLEWIADRPKPHLLVLDGHSSHIQYEVARLALENNVHILVLPSHTTSKLQPLDVAVFGPTKKVWLRVKREHQTMSAGQPITKEVFPSLMKKLRENGGFPSRNIVSGFSETGLWPVNRQVVLRKIPQEVSRSAGANSSGTISVDTSNGATSSSVDDAAGTSSVISCSVVQETPRRVALRNAILSRIVLTKPDRDITTRKRLNMSNCAMTSEDAMQQLRHQEDQQKQQKDKRKKLLPKPRARAQPKAAAPSSDSESETAISLHDDSDEEDSDDDHDSDNEKRVKKPRRVDSVRKDLEQLTVKELITGDFVTAVYQNQWFVGQVSAVTEEPRLHATHPYTVNYMQYIGTNQFRWPATPDPLLTHKDDILTEVKPPVPVNSRGILGLCAEDLERTRKLFLRL